MKKLQSCAGKADMFVERSRNKSIDKKSVLCYSESTNHVAIGIFVCDFFALKGEWNAEYEETEATGGN